MLRGTVCHQTFVFDQLKLENDEKMQNSTILSRYGDHYEWNKVVTCIHNVLSQQRYLEHYGEVTIRNLRNNVCTCKITFVKVNPVHRFLLFIVWVLTDLFAFLLKARYWGSDTNKNEVQGMVVDQSGSVIHQFGGLWHEGIFCDTLPTPKCVWKPSESKLTKLTKPFIHPIVSFCSREAAHPRPLCCPTDPQPKDYLLYYGFSTFAMELNELTPELRPLLPPTDSRLRPDQR